MPTRQRKRKRVVRYTTRRADEICRAIEKIGSVKEACKSIGLQPSTFYNWKKKYPEFSEKVDNAKLRYPNNIPANQLELAVQRLNEFLMHGTTEQQITTTRIECNGKVTIQETVKEIKRPTPPWVIQRVLGYCEPMDAVRRLLSEKLLTPQHAQIIHNAITGMQADMKNLIQKQERLAEEDKLQMTPPPINVNPSPHI
ncbi:MAG: transposase [Cyanobacteria bacterium P01_E01_bin.6]